MNTHTDIKKEHNRISALEYLLLILCAIAYPIGEKVNETIPMMSKLFVLAGFLFVVVFFIGNISHGKMTINIRNKYLLFFILFAIIHTFICCVLYFIGVYDYFSLGELIKNPVFILIAYCVCLHFSSNENVSYTFMKWYIFSTIITIFFFNNYIYDGSQSTGYVARMCGSFDNPNAFATCLLVGIFFNIYLVFKNIIDKKRIRVILYTCTFLILILAIVLSGSRGAMLGLLIGIVVFIFSNTTSRKIRRSFVLFGLLAGGVLFYFFRSEIIQYLSRFSNTTLNSSFASNERWVIWRSFLENIDKYFLLGTDRATMLSLNTQTSHSTPHNIYLAILVRYGFVGFVLFLLGLRKLFMGKKTMNKNTPYIFKIQYGLLRSLFIATVIGGFFIDALNIRFYWLAIFVLYAFTFGGQSYGMEYRDSTNG